MTTEQEEKIFEFMGKIDERTKNLLDKFNNLPCGRDDKRITELESYKNQMIGKVSMIGVITGAIGYGVTVAINYFIKNN